MKCLQCQFQNRESVQFCEKCGAKMDFDCPSCGAQIPSDREFCGQCGKRLAEFVEAEIGAKGILAQVYLDLGRLQQVKRRKHKAKECFSKAIELFEQCGAEVLLKQASEASDSLK